MKTKSLLGYGLVLLLSGLFLAQSCQKEKSVTAPVSQDPVSEAKAAFKKAERVHQLRTVGSSFLSDSLLKLRELAWDRAFFQTSGDTTTVFVPIDLPARITVISGGIAGTNLNDLMLLRLTDNGDGFDGAQGEMITLIPDREWKQGERFSGMVSAENWFEPEIYYQDRSVVKQRRQKDGSDVPVLKGGGCGTYWTEVCVGGSAEIPQVVCTNQPHIFCVTVPSLDGGGGGGPSGPGGPGGGGDVPNDPPPPGGGGGGKKEPATPSDDIKNVVNNPCLHGMVDKILDKGIEFTAGKSLQLIFGINGDFNLTFTETTTLDNLTGGVAKSGSSRVNGQLTNLDVEIKLNLNTLPASSQEYIATVIVHEAIHAYLYSAGFDDERTAIMQHEVMWVNYVDFIANYLQDNYNTPETDARSLAMDGLYKTFSSMSLDSIYQQLTGKVPLPSDQRAAIATKYREGKKGAKCN